VLKSFAVLSFLMVGAGSAIAAPVICPTGDILVGSVNGVCVSQSAPEIDPSSAASGLALLLGGLLVVRSRRTVTKLR
jgi:hypothetical protein